MFPNKLKAYIEHMWTAQYEYWHLSDDLWLD